MRQVITIGIIGLLFAGLAILFWPKPNDLEAVVKGWDKGEAVSIAEHFAPTKEVRLFLPNVDGVFTTAQAEAKLAAFFENNPVQGFKLLHIGDAIKAGDSYLIGLLVTDNNAFRVFMYLNENNVTHVEARAIEESV